MGTKILSHSPLTKSPPNLRPLFASQKPNILKKNYQIIDRFSSLQNLLQQLLHHNQPTPPLCPYTRHKEVYPHYFIYPSTSMETTPKFLPLPLFHIPPKFHHLLKPSPITPPSHPLHAYFKIYSPNTQTTSHSHWRL